MSILQFAILADRSDCRNAYALASQTRFLEAYMDCIESPIDYLETFDNEEILEALAVFTVLEITRN